MHHNDTDYESYDLPVSRLYGDPYPFYQRLRTRYPVHLDSQLGCWVVTSYKEVVQGLADRSLSSERTVRASVLQQEGWNTLEPLFSHISKLMFFSDPPKHTRIRTLVNKVLSARMVEQWRPRIHAIVDLHLGELLHQGRMDVIHDIAQPIPIQVIAELLGIPPSDRPQFRIWSDDLAEFLGNPLTLDLCKRLDSSINAFMMYFREIVARHRREPMGDLVDALLIAEEQGMKLSEDEILINCVGLFTGGHETTTNLIGNGLLALLRHPDTLHTLRLHPDLLPCAIEELLRFDSPVQFTARIAKQSTKIGEETIYKNQRVMLMLGAANRDPQQFAQPDQLDITRKDNRHMSFGNNIHYCIGAALARIEAQETLYLLLQRLPELHLATDKLEWRENLAFHGLTSLPIAW